MIELTSPILAVPWWAWLVFAVVVVASSLHYGLGGILLFVGGKMLTADLFSVPQWASLALTVAILADAIVPSLVSRRRRRLAQPTA